MCKCTPEIRTPYCGAKDCEWPDHGDAAPLVQPAESLQFTADASAIDPLALREATRLEAQLAKAAQEIQSLKTQAGRLQQINDELQDCGACRVLKSQVDALMKALDGKLIDKAPFIILKGCTREEYMRFARAFELLPKRKTNLEGMVMLGLAPGQDMESLTDAQLERMGFQRKTLPDQTEPCAGCKGEKQ